MTLEPQFQLCDKPCQRKPLTVEDQLSRIESVLALCEREPTPQEVAEAEFVLNFRRET